MKRFLKVAQVDRKVSTHFSTKYFGLFFLMKQVELLALFLVEVTLVEYQMVKFPPSLLA